MARVFSSDSGIIGFGVLAINKPRIVKGWWSDLNNKQIDRARLEEKVRFHIQTENVPNGSTIRMQLFDKDVLSPDDDDFDGEKIHKKVIVQANKGYVELELPVSWSQDLADEPIVDYRKLYWRVEIGQKKQDIDSFLAVFFSDRTLYVQPMSMNHNVPEIYSNDGSQLVPMLMDEIQSFAMDAAGEYIEQGIVKLQQGIVLAKLKKGYLVDSNGTVHSNITSSGGQRRIVLSELYAADGSEIIGLHKRGANFGNAHTTTKGVNQFAFFSRTNKKVQMLGAIKNNTGSVLAAYDLTKELYDAHSGNTKGLMTSTIVAVGSVICASASLGVSVLTAIGNDHWDRFEEEYNRSASEYYATNLAKLKPQGKDAVAGWLQNSAELIDGVTYELRPVSYETALAIWLGKLRREEDIKYSFAETSDVYLLLRRQPDKIRPKTEVFIVETFFIN